MFFVPFPGGPLMYLDKTTRRYVLIGTLKGQGYSCKYDTVDTFEGSTNGLWNKVSSHMEWIQDTMEELREKVCRGTNKKSSEELEQNKLTAPKSLSPHHGGFILCAFYRSIVNGQLVRCFYLPLRQGTPSSHPRLSC